MITRGAGIGAENGVAAHLATETDKGFPLLDGVELGGVAWHAEGAESPPQAKAPQALEPGMVLIDCEEIERMSVLGVGGPRRRDLVGTQLFVKL